MNDIVTFYHWTISVCLHMRERRNRFPCIASKVLTAEKQWKIKRRGNFIQQPLPSSREIKSNGNKTSFEFENGPSVYIASQEKHTVTCDFFLLYFSFNLFFLSPRCVPFDPLLSAIRMSLATTLCCSFPQIVLLCRHSYTHTHAEKESGKKEKKERYILTSS